MKWFKRDKYVYLVYAVNPHDDSYGTISVYHSMNKASTRAKILAHKLITDNVDNWHVYVETKQIH